MIAYLSDKLLEKQANTAIVDVGGVGYEVSYRFHFYELATSARMFAADLHARPRTRYSFLALEPCERGSIFGYCRSEVSVPKMGSEFPE